jgi:hypothetical protein
LQGNGVDRLELIVDRREILLVAEAGELEKIVAVDLVYILGQDSRK